MYRNQEMSLGLSIHTQSEHTLGKLESFYMSYEDENEDMDNPFNHNIKAKTLFSIYHEDLNNMMFKMGIENLFTLHRVFLSYYEASTILKKFWHNFINDIPIHNDQIIELNYIEALVSEYEIPIFNSQTLRRANHLLHEGKETYLEVNPFQEYLWATQMSEFLQFYKLAPFSKPKMEIRDIFKSSYIFKGAMLKKEISAVLYEWANLYSYKQPDFIKRISNILEIINSDIIRNKNRYDQLSTIPEVNQLVYSLNHQIHSNRHHKQCFFGVFNASDLLGAYSRHGSFEVSSIKGINTDMSLSCKGIINSWRQNNLLPSDKQFMRLFNLWYFTTSYLLINWLRLPHFTNES